MVVAGLTVWSESSQVHSAFPPQPTRYWASKLITIGWGSLHSAKPDHAVQRVVSALLMRFCFECRGIVPVGKYSSLLYYIVSCHFERNNVD